MAARRALLPLLAIWVCSCATTVAPRSSLPADLEAMLEQLDAAQLALQNGNAEPFKALCSQGADATVAGGFGGEIAVGWARIAPRLDWVASRFSGGTHTRERLTGDASGDLAYVVQREEIRYRDPASGAESARRYRVTMVLRREAGAWKLLHRHADTMVDRPGAAR